VFDIGVRERPSSSIDQIDQLLTTIARVTVDFGIER
jgi:hypothetical protein